LAEADLAQRTRRDKANHKPHIDELRMWCFCLAHAVYELHKNSIIHADIKASNVLIYADGSVRLTDYTLATKKWAPTQKFTHNVCTCTHRPLECLLRREWDEALDIWSLGCTYYEIAYGELLFPYQGVLEPNPKIKDREAKDRLRNRSINAIVDWATRGPNPPTRREVLGDPVPRIDYIQYALCEDFSKAEMSHFNDLVCKMLVVDPSQRPTIRAVLDHPFFKGLRAPVYLSIQRPLNPISLAEQARVTRYIQRYSANETVQALALSIYRRCNDLHHIDEPTRSAGCVWIASKIVVGYPPQIGLPKHQMLVTEREICHNLVFRLHTL
jgi:serine/threonine protein kinase